VRRLPAFLPFLFLLAPAAKPAAPETTPFLRDRIAAKIESFHGVMGVAATNLDTGQTLAINGDMRFPTASLIKVGVMVEIYDQMAEGKFRPDTILTLHEGDKAGDEPVVLNQLHGGIRLSVADLLAMMIEFSDNTATNLLVNLAGTAAIDKRLESYGLKDTLIFRPTFHDGHADVHPELEKEYGLGMTTPKEMARLFELIARGKILNHTVCKEMLGLLEKQQDRAMIPRLLPFEREKIVVANKTGTDEEKTLDARGVRGQVRCDAAYVAGPRTRYVIAICARRIEDPRWSVDNEALTIGAEISRMIYDEWEARP
jgi:beta-lactamase class A